MLTKWFRLYLITAVTFLAVDYVWLTRLAEPFYRTNIGHLLREDPLIGGAALFYLVYIAGVVVFAVSPGLERGSLRFTAGRGAFLGFFAYATFDLTSYAMFEGFPAIVVVVDLLWGATLTATAAVIAHAAVRRLASVQSPPAS
jgi:uncharacterized membrane protein